MKLSLMRNTLMTFCAFTLLCPERGYSTPQQNSSYRFGLGISIEAIQTNADLTLDLSGGDLNLTHTFQSHKKQRVTFSPFLEFGRIFDEKYYLGICINFHPINTTSHNSSYLTREYTQNQDYKVSYSFDALLKAGGYLNPFTMLYLKVGPSFMKWKHTTTFLEKDNPGDALTISKNSLGLSLGLGFESPISDHLKLSFDYTHSFYAKQSQTKNMSYKYHIAMGGFETRTGPVTKSISPSTGTLALRLTYCL